MGSGYVGVRRRAMLHVAPLAPDNELLAILPQTWMDMTEQWAAPIFFSAVGFQVFF